jgi:hypothetical protein
MMKWDEVGQEGTSTGELSQQGGIKYIRCEEAGMHEEMLYAHSVPLFFLLCFRVRFFSLLLSWIQGARQFVLQPFLAIYGSM